MQDKGTADALQEKLGTAYEMAKKMDKRLREYKINKGVIIAEPNIDYKLDLERRSARC